MGLDDNGGIDLKTPGWPEVLHALPAPASTFPDSQSILFNSLRQYDRMVKNRGFGVRQPKLNSQFQHSPVPFEQLSACYLTTHCLSVPIYEKGMRMSTLQVCCKYYMQTYRTCLSQGLNCGTCARNDNCHYYAMHTWR